jgi:hypothetical protein
MSYKEQAFALLQSKKSSNWLKRAVLDLAGREVKYVIEDLELLLGLFELKQQEEENL